MHTDGDTYITILAFWLCFWFIFRWFLL